MNRTDKKLIKDSLDSLNKALTGKTSVKNLMNTDVNETKKLIQSLDDNFLSIEKGLNFKLVKPLKDAIEKIKDDFKDIKGDISDDLKRKIKETNTEIKNIQVLQKVQEYQKKNVELTKQIYSHFNIKKVFGFGAENEQEEDERIVREQKRNEILTEIEKTITDIPNLLKELPEKIGIQTGKGLFGNIGGTLRNIFTGKGLLGGIAHWGTAIFGGLEMGDYLAKQGIDLSKLENLPMALNKGFSHLISKITLGIFKEKEVETFFTNIGNSMVDSIKMFIGEDTFNKILKFTSFAQDLWRKFYVGFTAFVRWSGSGFTGSYDDYIKEIEEELNGNFSKRLKAQEELIKSKRSEIESLSDIADSSHGELMVKNYIEGQKKTALSWFDISSFEELENEIQKAIDEPMDVLSNKIQGYGQDTLNASLKYVQGIRQYQKSHNMEDTGLTRSQMLTLNEKYAKSLEEQSEINKALLEKKKHELAELENQLINIQNEETKAKSKVLPVSQGQPRPNVEVLNTIKTNSEMMEQFAVEAEKQAKSMDTVGQCFSGTNAVLRKFGIHNVYGDANTVLPEMLKNKNFESIPLNTKEDFYNLPRGAIVISSASDINPHGHGYTVLGGGLEASDHIQKLTAGRNRKGEYGQSYAFIYKGSKPDIAQSNITDSAINMSIGKQAEIQAKMGEKQQVQPIINNFNTSNNISNGRDIDNNTSNGLTQMIALTQKWFMSGVGGSF